MALENYYNRYDPKRKYTKSLFRAGYALQSPELNEMQEYANAAIAGFGDAIFKDGDVIKGCVCVVDGQTGAVTVEAGRVYLRGLIRDVGVGNLAIPITASVKIGVYFLEKTITELEDSGLRDPAVGTRGFQEPGAGRIQYNCIWGFKIDGVTENHPELGEFFTIYSVENGVLIQTAPAPQLDSVSQSLARYDRESHGSYVVDGMNVTCLSAENKKQVFSVNNGKAHVDGYEVALSYSIRSHFDDEIDVKKVLSDPYTFSADSLGNMKVTLNYQPLNEIISVDITAQKKATLTHGSYSGAQDPLPDSSVQKIVVVTQGGNTYVETTDFTLKSGCVDWSPIGSEPAPGSSYDVIYQYRKRVNPTNITDSGFTISGAVDGSLVLVDYSWKMPRYDVITIDAEGIVRRINGLAHEWTPAIPKVPNGQLALAHVHQTWKRDQKPDVTNMAIRVVVMSEIEKLRSLIDDLMYTVAEERLKSDANARDPSTKKGIFVEPFFDDDMRDQGIAQTGAIVDKCLTLPIAAEVIDLAKMKTVFMLPYALEPVILQELLTGEMKINPYMAFDPIPAELAITLNVDRWTDVETQWLSAVTNYFSSSWGSSTSTSNQLVSSNTKLAEYMRQIKQHFSVSGLLPGEVIKDLTFDTIKLEIGE